MSKRIVLIPLLENSSIVHLQDPSSTSMSSISSWSAWSRTHGIELVVQQELNSSPIHQDLPPTVLRWQVLSDLLTSRGPDAQVLMVDADTIVNLSAPNIFDEVPNAKFGLVLNALPLSSEPVMLRENTHWQQP
jgi:hypothetical protein